MAMAKRRSAARAPGTPPALDGPGQCELRNSENRARSLGWLSAATNLGVALGGGGEQEELCVGVAPEEAAETGRPDGSGRLSGTTARFSSSSSRLSW